MKTFKVKEEVKLETYPELFGLFEFKGMPLFFYAEQLFFQGMVQMVEGYNGGYYDFIKISTNDTQSEELIDISEKGFLPLITSDKEVVLETPFNVKQTLSYQGACLVVWLFVLEQIASKVNNQLVQDRIIETMQDFKYLYSRLLKEDGTKLFSKRDCSAIATLLD